MRKEVVKEEYYPVCPGCGAKTDGAKICAYCGSSLLKSRTVETADDTAAALAGDKIAVDYNCAGIGDKSDALFGILFGGIFCGVPLVIAITFLGIGLRTGDLLFSLLPLGILVIFWAIGIPFLVSSVKKITAKRKILENGREYTAEVVGHTNSLVNVNNAPMVNIKVAVDLDGVEGTKKIVLVSSGSTSGRGLYPVGSYVTIVGWKNQFVLKK